MTSPLWCPVSSVPPAPHRANCQPSLSGADTILEAPRRPSSHTHTQPLWLRPTTLPLLTSASHSLQKTETDVSVFTQRCTNIWLVFRQASSHRPDQALGGYRWVARTDFPLRGLTAIKESRAVFLLSSSSSSSSRLSNWCCSRTNNTPCAPAYRENNTRLKSPDCICWLMLILYDYMSTDLHRRNILWYKLCGINPLRGGFSAAAVQSSNSCLIQKYIKL